MMKRYVVLLILYFGCCHVVVKADDETWRFATSWEFQLKFEESESKGVFLVHLWRQTKTNLPELVETHRYDVFCDVVGDVQIVDDRASFEGGYLLCQSPVRYADAHNEFVTMYPLGYIDSPFLECLNGMPIPAFANVIAESDMDYQPIIYAHDPDVADYDIMFELNRHVADMFMSFQIGDWDVVSPALANPQATFFQTVIHAYGNHYDFVDFWRDDLVSTVDVVSFSANGMATGAFEFVVGHDPVTLTVFEGSMTSIHLDPTCPSVGSRGVPIPLAHLK